MISGKVTNIVLGLCLLLNVQQVAIRGHWVIRSELIWFASNHNLWLIIYWPSGLLRGLIWNCWNRSENQKNTNLKMTEVVKRKWSRLQPKVVSMGCWPVPVEWWFITAMFTSFNLHNSSPGQCFWFANPWGSVDRKYFSECLNRTYNAMWLMFRNDLTWRDNLIFKTKQVNLIKLLLARFSNQNQSTINVLKDVVTVHHGCIDKWTFNPLSHDIESGCQ